MGAAPWRPLDPELAGQSPLRGQECWGSLGLVVQQGLLGWGSDPKNTSPDLALQVTSVTSCRRDGDRLVETTPEWHQALTLLATV